MRPLGAFAGLIACRIEWREVYSGITRDEMNPTRMNIRQRKARLFLTCAALIGLAAEGPNHGAAAEVPGSRPNLVFVLADDLGYGDPRCYNPASKIPTPNMDRLAAEGIRFLDAHTPSSVCTPTRYGIMTGRYCWRSRMKSGVLNGYDPFLIEPGRWTVPSFLRQEGYATAGIGKWHLGLGNTKPADFAGVLRPGPISAGFDYFFGIPASLDMPPYVFFENERVTVAPTNQMGASEMRRKGGGGFWREGAIAPGFTHEGVLPTITARAVQYIREQPPGKGKPFFLYFALTAPHTRGCPPPNSGGGAARVFMVILWRRWTPPWVRWCASSTSGNSGKTPS